MVVRHLGTVGEAFAESTELDHCLLDLAILVLSDGELNVREDEDRIDFGRASVFGNGLLVIASDEVDLSSVVEAVVTKRKRKLKRRIEQLTRQDSRVR